GAWVREMVEHLRPLRTRGVDLDPSVAEHAPKERLLGRGVLDAVDGDRLRGPTEDSGVDLDALVGERVRSRLPADPDDDQPEPGDRDGDQADDGAEMRNAGAGLHKDVDDARNHQHDDRYHE